MDIREETLNGIQEQLNSLRQNATIPGAVLDNPDMDRWEMDPSVFLDNLKNQILGNTKVNSVWVPDPNKDRIMNEQGAHRFIAELESRVSIHMQMSELDKQEIREITADAGAIYADLLEDNWQDWEVKRESLSSELESIALMFTHNMWILLHIAMKAGMRKHRERRGIKTGITPQETPMGAY